MLKVLYLSLGDQTATATAFRNVGVQLEVYDYWSRWEQTKNSELIANEFMTKVRQFQPNLIHMQLQYTGVIKPHTLVGARQACPGVVMTNWSGDCRAVVQRYFVEIANVVDHSLMSSTGHLEMYQKAGAKNIKYWQIGYDPNFNKPLNYNEFLYDAVFIGNNYGHTFPDSHIRSGAVSFLTQALPRFKAFGTGYGGNIQAIAFNQMNEVYNKSICPISISNFNSVAHYFSDRLLYCVASGRPTISWYFPGCESYFVEGKEIFYAKSNKDIVDAVNYCKANPEIAKQIGIDGHKRVLKEHTFDSRIIELLHIANLAHLV